MGWISKPVAVYLAEIVRLMQEWYCPAVVSYLNALLVYLIWRASQDFVRRGSFRAAVDLGINDTFV